MSIPDDKLAVFTAHKGMVDNLADRACLAFSEHGITLDGDDIRQTAEEYLYLSILEYKGPEENFGKFASRLISKMLRRYISKYYALKDEMKDCGDCCIEDLEEHMELSKAISRLPVRERAYIQMYYYDNMCFADIAKATGESEGCIATAIENTLRCLKNAMM